MDDRPGMTGADRFAAFVREYQDMVFGTAVRLVGSPAEAEDVAQTVFLKAFERFDELERNPRAPGWLKTVTRNLCLNHLARYRRRWRFFSELDSPDARSGRQIYADRIEAPPAADAVETGDRQAQLEAALGRLPDHQRVPLVLFHFEEMGYQAIADALGVSLGKVKTDIHRARLSLRAALTRPPDER